jgi:hypothetical protein
MIGHGKVHQMGSQNGAVAKRKTRRYNPTAEVVHKFVDFHANQTDFLCVMLAACGWSTRAIAAHTNLTEGQVVYRIGKSERDRGDGNLTQRSAYRNGSSPVANAIVQTISSRGSMVSREVKTTLDSRGLYTPRPSGVMNHQRK